MMAESLPGKYRLSPLGNHHDERRRAVRSRSAAAIALALLFAGPAPRRARTRPIAPLSKIRRIVAANWRSRERSRPRQQLLGLSDLLLKDIGLRREGVGYEFRKPFWHCD